MSRVDVKLPTLRFLTFIIQTKKGVVSHPLMEDAGAALILSSDPLQTTGLTSSLPSLSSHPSATRIHRITELRLAGLERTSAPALLIEQGHPEPCPDGF